MNTKKWIITLLVVGIVGAVIGYNYIYQDHRDIASEKAAFTLTAEELSDAFKNDEAQATALYLNKTIAVTGTIATASDGTAVMEPGVFFALSEHMNPSTAAVQGTSVRMKGRCIGYDSLLEEIKFDQAIIIN